MATIGLASTVRDARLQAIADAAGGSAKIKLYDGTQPTTGGTATNLLATLVCDATAFGAVSGGVLTIDMDPDLQDTVDADGAATWARITTSADVFVADVDVTQTGGGGTIQLDNVNLVTGGTVTLTSGTLTEGNS